VAVILAVVGAVLLSDKLVVEPVALNLSLSMFYGMSTSPQANCFDLCTTGDRVLPDVPADRVLGPLPGAGADSQMEQPDASRRTWVHAHNTNEEALGFT
jgi:hypothetical protein